MSRRLQARWELRTDGLTISDDLKRFRESGGYQKMLDWFADRDNAELLNQYQRMLDNK